VSTYGGKHPNTAALKNVLAAQGVRAPHNGESFTEAMLLGIGGGLGAGYILWEFKQHESAIIVLGFRNRWNYATEHLTTLCKRIGIAPVVQEASGRKAADANLEKALKANTPVVAWVDKAHLPHQQLPESLKGYASHVVGVHGANNGQILVDDIADHLFAVPADVFAAGRGRIGSDKNRLFIAQPPAKINLKGAILAGIQDHIEHLGRDSESFSLPVYKKWAKLMTDSKNKKGWPVVFKNRKGLYSTLRSIYEGVVLDGTDGCGLRGMYADFLEEASGVIGNPALEEAVQQYQAVAGQWAELANAAMPADAPSFKQTHTLMDKRYALYKQNKLAEMRSVSDEMERLQAEFDHAFPLKDAEIGELFATLQQKLEAIYDGETRALAALQKAI
jgi:hypothetical protein